MADFSSQSSHGVRSLRVFRGTVGWKTLAYRASPIRPSSSDPRLRKIATVRSYLNLLFATMRRAALPPAAANDTLPQCEPDPGGDLVASEGAEIELRAPVFKVYGEEL